MCMKTQNKKHFEIRNTKSENYKVYVAYTSHKTLK